ncbi:pleiotropic regulatory protein RsmS [Vibrio sp. CK2-1]|uniref:pleiotropic regulatory protein RsmS n=1 Tax=Vibrio sp. CK2-1 TaxID=2912249 RepID=UPI001F37472C|nr:pleiotropic regulatory protein RsmS [Vibrio sp. CK2-1]MCF7354544.1 pleiotropic regulatory protein RsmS [Vibrio sp. CK2-1]
MTTDNQPSPLDSAPEEIKLAVDLIYLLESNEIDPSVALEALKIVEADLQKKIEKK